MLFVPGYVLVAALFPEAGTATERDAEETLSDSASGDDGTAIDGIERAALSFVLSIAIVPLASLVLNFTPVGIRLVPIMLALSVLVTAATVIAARRRQALPEDERFVVPFRQWYADARAELLNPADRTDAVLNILLVLSVLLAASSVAYAVGVPKQGEQFTEVYLLTETDDGDLIADDYPMELTVGESAEIVVGTGNHERETADYTVVSFFQRVEIEGNSTCVLNQREFERFGADGCAQRDGPPDPTDSADYDRHMDPPDILVVLKRGASEPRHR